MVGPQKSTRYFTALIPVRGILSEGKFTTFDVS